LQRRIGNENVTEDTVESELTCDAGSRAGVITIHFRPTAGEGENTFEGPWEIVRVSTEFEGISGEGDFTAVRDIEALTIAQVQTGEFRLE
jgi:hypothetical protein